MSAEPALLYELSSTAVVPDDFPSPFNTGVCDLAIDAARSLQSRLPQLCSAIHDFDRPDGGKMMGVLVVKTSSSELAYLSAFSGMLGNRWQWAGFTPPVFNLENRKAFLDQGEATVARVSAEINSIKASEDYKSVLLKHGSLQRRCSKALAESNITSRALRLLRALQRTQPGIDQQALIAESREDKRRHRELKVHWDKKIAASELEVAAYSYRIEALAVQRSELSRQLQKKVFDGYTIKSYSGETRSLQQLFGDKTPSGGAGDCAAIKLFDYCIEHQLTPMCMAEFWWGSVPASGVRHHGSFYPSCRGKCGVILPFMLRGIATNKPAHEILPDFPADQPSIVFEDDAIIVINKPAGMLSVPGKVSVDSVEYRLRAQHPQTSNSNLLVHRLDQATSGLLLAAKTKSAHKNLQQQFQQRLVEKRYCAILSSTIADDSGVIDLPLRVDIDDRPRQLVCYEHGKNAVTSYRVISKTADTTRVEFKPVTGRTHQLRLHAAHHLGLNAAIVGDDLYGAAAKRLYLHAEHLAFDHPITGIRVEFAAPTPF